MHDKTFVEFVNLPFSLNLSVARAELLRKSCFKVSS